MYDYIIGKLTYKGERSKTYSVTIEACGVGYSVEVPYRDFNTFDENRPDIKVYVSLIHREDKMYLCGFLKREDRDMFNILTSVSGVGSKMALTLLNNFNTADLVSCVINQDYKSLMRAKGVGQKLAQKIILDLKGKFNEFTETDFENSHLNDSTFNSEYVKDAKMVLLSLGYESKEINSALNNVLNSVNPNSSTEEILKKTLQILSV